MCAIDCSTRNLLPLDRYVGWRLNAQADATACNPNDGDHDIAINDQPLIFFASKH
jgi:hypothetical protein